MENIKIDTILRLLTSSGASIEVSENISKAIKLANEIVFSIECNELEKKEGQVIYHSTIKDTLFSAKGEIGKYKRGVELSIYLGMSKKSGTAQVGSGAIFCVDDTRFIEMALLYKDIGTLAEIELSSLHFALEVASAQLQHFDKITIYTSATYGVKSISYWAYSWKNNGWRKPNGAIKNLKAIQDSHELYNKIKENGKVSFYLLDDESENIDSADNVKIMDRIKEGEVLSVEAISDKIYGSKSYIYNNQKTKEKTNDL